MKAAGHILVAMMPVFCLWPGTGHGADVVNPHREPAQCLSCHKKTPTGEQTGGDPPGILKDTIDGTCHICHPYDCCRIHSLKGHNHPSCVSMWDVENFTQPEKLPLYDGYITCLTCHLHRYGDGPDYKMVRLVQIGLSPG